jgi:hypothetical protein
MKVPNPEVQMPLMHASVADISRLAAGEPINRERVWRSILLEHAVITSS